MPKPTAKTSKNSAIQVSLVVIPEVMLSTLTSIYDVLNCLPLLVNFDDDVPKVNPFRVEIISPEAGEIKTASGLPVLGQRTINGVDRTDIVIIPSLMVEGGEWEAGRYPALVDWLSRMHARGAMLCSACSGVLLLAETGLLDGLEATVHWAYAGTFRENFPRVRLRVEKTLVTAGDRLEMVMSGASSSWHDLVLYLVARYAGPAMAQAVAKFMLLQWHVDGQAPYAVFQPKMNHNDAVVLGAQEWVRDHFTAGKPVDQMASRSGLPGRTFKRRFKIATGYSPIEYVQALRIESAKCRLERTGDPVEDISWQVGYEDPAFFRRLFKRTTGLSPGVYRRKFQLPKFFRAEDLESSALKDRPGDVTSGLFNVVGRAEAKRGKKANPARGSCPRAGLGVMRSVMPETGNNSNQPAISSPGGRVRME